MAVISTSPQRIEALLAMKVQSSPSLLPVCGFHVYIVISQAGQQISTNWREYGNVKDRFAVAAIKCMIHMSNFMCLQKHQAAGIFVKSDY